jgi:hypothetical protein
MDGVEKAAGRCIRMKSQQKKKTKNIEARTIRRADLQIYTNVRKQNGLCLIVRNCGNVAGPIIQGTDVRLGPNTGGVESDDVGKPASCDAEIQIYRRGYYVRRNCVCFLSKLQ